VGDATAAGCLVDLNGYARELDLERLSAACVGPSFASYVYEDALWALPIDAACQTAATRPVF
jgi:multiple sugar transport system substrate-binding protein